MGSNSSASCGLSVKGCSSALKSPGFFSLMSYCSPGLVIKTALLLFLPEEFDLSVFCSCLSS